ncbi:MAG: SpoIIIAH-like family protein [Bacilli bacterium]|nr:SpoIIIAH-like family protein [Bacilli bacterium]
MISKQNLWFLTLFSLILVLSVYYITMPNDLLKDVEVSENENITATVDEVDSLLAMRVSLEEERQTSIDALQEQLVSDVLGTEEKNNIYEQLKYLNEIQSREEEIEKSIKKDYGVNCFVKIDKANAEVVCVANEHNNKLANNIMRLIQKEYKNKVFVTVKFQKK